jgi:biotin carboxylase
MARVLVLATTTGYQTRAFGEAAERLGVELVFATDRCDMIEDPWRDRAIAIRFYDEAAAVSAILSSLTERPVDGILVVGDRPTVIGARVGEALGLPGHPPAAATAARSKRLTRERLLRAGLRTPWFLTTPLDADALDLSRTVQYPAVIKPLALSGSRGVMRANDPGKFVAAFERLRTLLQSPDVRVERSELHDWALVEGFIPGREYAVEGLLHHGRLQLLAIFDKPDPLDGPFFEETIYIAPSTADPQLQTAMVETLAAAASGLGLEHGPIHAECRVNGDGIFVLEVAARPIGGLCARALRFEGDPPEIRISLEELLLRHALGASPEGWRREARASGVMMIPIPKRGTLRSVEGMGRAREVPGIEDIRITSKTDQLLVPLPEGASYLGFIFARSERPQDVDRALREAHARLCFTIDPEIRLYAHRTAMDQRLH